MTILQWVFEEERAYFQNLTRGDFPDTSST